MVWASTTSVGLLPCRAFFALVLILLAPLFVVIFSATLQSFDGNIPKLVESLLDGRFDAILPRIEAIDIYIFTAFALFELVLMKIIPGKRYTGPITEKGNIPEYSDNGLACYVISVAGFVVLSDGLTLLADATGVHDLPHGFNLFRMSLIYDRLGSLLMLSSALGLILCAFLTIKGRLFPSTSDNGSNGSLIFDYYWGTELYPRIFGFDVKLFTNCRFGMMSWALIIISCVAHQIEETGRVCDSLLVSVILQLIYCTKFFHWESGYMSSVDIMHDRAGFYICWGCMAFLPAIYTSPAVFLAHQERILGTAVSSSILITGIFGIYLNYKVDKQRQNFRNSSGKSKVFGKDPEYIVAHYKTKSDNNKTSLLLCSGFWGWARHFNYVPELLAALCWCLPAVMGNKHPGWIAMFYFPYLVLLLVDRACRDDERCSRKYGSFWEKYCEIVPYRIIPGIF
eukprot:156910_1